MRRVRLGKTDLQVSPIAFGTWQLSGSWGQFGFPPSVHGPTTIQYLSYGTEVPYGQEQPGDRHLEAFWTKREQAELVARSAERLTRGGFGAPEAIAQPPRGTASPFMNTRPW